MRLIKETCFGVNIAQPLQGHVWENSGAGTHACSQGRSVDQVPNFPKATEVRRYQQGTFLVIDDKRKVQGRLRSQKDLKRVQCP